MSLASYFSLTDKSTHPHGPTAWECLSRFSFLTPTLSLDDLQILAVLVLRFRRISPDGFWEFMKLVCWESEERGVIKHIHETL